MGVTVKRTGKAPDLAAIVGADAARRAAAIPALIRARVKAGRDIFDRPFAPYDREYAAENRGAVDLDAGGPGGLLATLVVRVVRRGADVVITVAPDTVHARVGAFLHNGTPQMKPRPWLGLSPKDLVVLNRARS